MNSNERYQKTVVTMQKEIDILVYAMGEAMELLRENQYLGLSARTGLACRILEKGLEADIVMKALQGGHEA